jgi:hypothetical protein
MTQTHVGRVDSVTVDDKRRTVFVDVITSPRKTFDEIRFVMPSPGIWAVPEVGDIVEVVDDSQKDTTARFPQKQPDFAMPPGLSTGDVALQVDDGSYIHFQTSGDTTDVVLDVDGQIYVGQPGNAEPVATASHTHDFTYVGKGDGASEQSNTTEGPSDVTDAQVE